MKVSSFLIYQIAVFAGWQLTSGFSKILAILIENDHKV
ncbi:hypothetical protein VEA_004243 [Vibrio antiquarius]|uniref:Uncharacterized protein n=1 Tax=Vibrio antiquarius (strain Ex25) TaxID=150340 RepID=A0ACA6QPZ2_VIBAE|nr:hypothetical protein VEA_004243 [Vibrio antiquarius]